MIKRILSLLIALQILAGVAWADKTVFIDGNPATRSPGTRVTAAFLNALNNMRNDGQNADGSGVLDYAHDTGAANAIAIALTPALTAHVEGMPVYLKILAPNTGPTTLAINGLAPVEIVHRDGSSMAAGELLASQIIGVAYNGSHYQLTLYEPPAAQLVPPGAIQAFGMATAPTGWLPCDGRVVSRATYPALFAAIGTTFGAGDSVTTFGLPDTRGEFLRGWDNTRGVDAGRGFGSWQAAMVGPHVHTPPDDSDGTSYGLVGKSLPGASVTEVTVDSLGSGSQPNTIASPVQMTDGGGTENRVRNLAIFYAIKD